MILFEVGCLKHYLPISDKVIIFFFLAEIPWHFAWKNESKVEFFCFFVN